MPEASRFHTDEKLKEVARDLVGGLIFMSDQVKRPEDLTVAFAVLLFMKKEDLEAWQKAEVVHFYEYLTAAGPRSINGYPFFTSCRPLTRGDYMKLREYEEKLRSAMNAAL